MRFVAARFRRLSDGEYRNWMEISPHRKNEAGAKNKIYTGRMGTRIPDDQRGLKLTGEIPEVPESYSFFKSIFRPLVPASNRGARQITAPGCFGGREQNSAYVPLQP